MTTYYVNGKKMKGTDKLTKNFTVREFASKDGDKNVKIDMEAVKKLQMIRDALDTPIIINSAYRSPKHNANVGGAKGSQHVLGRALDVRVAGYSPTEIAGYMLDVGFTGVSIYDTFAHGDTRPLSGNQKYVTWGKYQHRLKRIPLPKKPKPIKPDTPKDFTYQTDYIKFDIDGKIVTLRGFKRFYGNDTKFIQYIAVRDLECLGFKVNWKDGITDLVKTNSFREPTLNVDYLIDGISHSMVNLTHKGKDISAEGYVRYDKGGKATQFIPVKNLKGVGFDVQWDGKRELVVLK